VHVATKLCRRFVAEQATGCEVAAAARFLATGGDLLEVMRTILRSEAFRDPRYYRTKAKRPLHAVASLARAVGVSNRSHFVPLAVIEIRNMGEDLYGAGPPIGWPDVSTAWRGEGPFVYRLNLAHIAASGEWGLRGPTSVGTTSPQQLATAVERRLLLGGAGAVTHRELVQMLNGLQAYARLAAATTLVLSAPDFANH
jgi:uncharacterized protein (DUF1800 family)